VTPRYRPAFQGKNWNGRPDASYQHSAPVGSEFLGRPNKTPNLGIGLTRENEYSCISTRYLPPRLVLQLFLIFKKEKFRDGIQADERRAPRVRQAARNLSIRAQTVLSNSDGIGVAHQKKDAC
jgi:hypothetical protein